MKRLYSILLLLILLCSCKPQKQIQTEYVYIDRTDSLTRLHSQIDSLVILMQLRDSISVKDSVFVKEKGDTVYVERWHIEYREKAISDNLQRVKIQTDTVFQTITETVDRDVEKTVIKEVNVLRWWQKTLIWIGGAAILSLLMIGGIKLMRR